MAPNLGGWIHSFAVTETQLHKGGYTIYKITSIVFPRSLPQALTCLTVWKRFHDVKRLHRDLLRRHRSLQLPGSLPEPTDASFFKRFDAAVIQRRREYILELLDFAAQHPALYKCHAFAQFFSDAQQLGVTPCSSPPPLHRLSVNSKQPHSTSHADKAAGAIAEICDKLDLLYDPFDTGLTLLDPERDKQEVARQEDDNENNKKSLSDEVMSSQKGAAIDKATEQQIDNQPLIGEPCRDYTRFLTPMASIESDDSDYIYEAALEFSHAVQAEANLEYREAHEHYKHGVELLLKGSKDDANDERRYIAKTKIAKYLARADDIHEKFLTQSADSYASIGSTLSKSNFQLSIDVNDATPGISSAIYLERPWNHLAKYKVLQVLGESVMQVQCITEAQRPTYVMKGIEKPSSNSPTQTIFLPQQVPYMVDLYAFFQSEQKIFLLLRQAEGGRLYDYIQTYTPTTNKRANIAGLFPEVQSNATIGEAQIEEGPKIEIASDASHLSIKPDDVESVYFNELLRNSQQLLQSVSNTLKAAEASVERPKCESMDAGEVQSHASTRCLRKEVRKDANTKIPEASLKQWARELAVAVHSLHAKGVILSDLHMENLLLGAKGQLLLTYFYQNEGLTSDDSYVHKAHSPAALAGHFVAPERPLSCKSDWWSYGVVLYQLLVGQPFKTTHPGNMELYGFVQYPESLEISDCACDLLENLLQQVPEERFDYEQLQAHAFFKGTNWKEVRRNGLNVAVNTTVT